MLDLICGFLKVAFVWVVNVLQLLKYFEAGNEKIF